MEELYRGELISELSATRGVGTWQIDPLRLSRAIVDAVNRFKTRDPERVERLCCQLRFSVLAFTREQAARFLIAERQAIIAELERTKVDYLGRGQSFRASIDTTPTR